MNCMDRYKEVSNSFSFMINMGKEELSEANNRKR